MSCPSCGWPTAEARVISRHRTSEGTVRYLRCVCGQVTIQAALRRPRVHEPRALALLGGAHPRHLGPRPCSTRPAANSDLSREIGHDKCHLSRANSHDKSDGGQASGRRAALGGGVGAGPVLPACGAGESPWRRSRPRRTACRSAPGRRCPGAPRGRPPVEPPEEERRADSRWARAVPCRTSAMVESTSSAHVVQQRHPPEALAGAPARRPATASRELVVAGETGPAVRIPSEDLHRAGQGRRVDDQVGRQLSRTA